MPMTTVRITPTTDAIAHFNDPTCVTMILPSRFTLRPDSAPEVANSPKHHDRHEDRADHDPRQRQREDDLPEDPAETRAQIARRLDDVAVNPAQHEGDRANHEHAIDLRHADDHRQFGKQQNLDGLLNDTQFQTGRC